MTRSKIRSVAHPMTRALPALLLAACSPVAPATAPAAAPAAAAATPIVPSGPPIANTGTFTPVAGHAPRFRRTEVTQAGLQVTSLTFAITKVEQGLASFTVTAADKKTGAFEVAGGNYYWPIVDTNLKSADVWATAKAEGEEAVAVPAGYYTCTRTRYQKQVTPAAFIDITRWTHGTAGLVKAQVANKLTVGALSQTTDLKLELEQQP
jgi:hypothetical protein